MSTRGGLYWRLRDGKTPWQDRVKLVRYAWKHDNVLIPNKHQTLLDWLLLALAGKRRIDRAEVRPVWRCLQDILLTSKCHLVLEHGQPLLLKPVIYQVLLDELQLHYSQPSKANCPDCDVILSCIASIVTSPTIGYSFTSKYELMQQLLSTLLSLCTKELNVTSYVPEQWCHLVDVVLDKYKACQKLKSNPQMVVQQVCNRLLSSIIAFLHAVAKQSIPVKSLQGIKEKVILVMASALFSKDLLEWYMLYLRTKFDPSIKETAPPKFILTVFSHVTDMLADEHLRQATLCYLPIFYEQFNKMYKVLDKPVGFHLLMYVCELVGIIPSESGSDASEQMLKCLASLLAVTVNEDVYLPALDVTSGGALLTWLQNLANWLLTLSNRSCWWFTSLSHLLQLNHSTLEVRLTALLSAVWIDCPKPTDNESTTAQGHLVCELITIYNQLRQVPRLIDKSMMAVQQKVSNVTMVWPRNAKERLGAVMSELPQGLCIDVWKRLLTEVRSYIATLQQGIQDKKWESQLCSILAIFSVFLLNIRVADYSITAQTSSQVRQLMTKTHTDVTCHLIPHCQYKKNSCWNVILYFMWSWGELHLLLRNYTGYDLEGLQCFQVAGETPHMDLSYVFPAISADTWCHLYHKDNLTSRQFCYMLEKLSLQKVRALISCRNQKESDQLIKSVVIWLCQLAPHPQEVHLLAQWDGQSDLDEDTYPVAHWKLMCDNLPMLLQYCSQEYLMAIARYVVWTSKSSSTDSGDGVLLSLPYITHNALCQSELSELRSLQTCIVTSLAHSLKQEMKKTTIKKSPKKFTPGVISPVDVLKALADTGMQWNMDSDMSEESAVWKKLHDIGQLMENVLERSRPKVTAGDPQLTLRYLKLMELLPVVYFSSANHVRCLVMVIAVLYGHPAEDGGAIWNNVRQKCYHLIEVYLDRPQGGIPIFNLINAGKLLAWMLKDLTKHNPCKMHVMTQLGRLASKSPATLIDLQPYVWRLVEQLEQMATTFTTNQSQIAMLQAAVNLQKVFSQILLRDTVKESLVEQLLTYYRKLSETFLNVVRFYLGRGASLIYRKNHLVALLLEGSAVILEHHSGEGELKATKLQPLCTLCLDLLGRKCTRQTVLSSLRFVRAICRHHTHIQDKLPENFLNEVWSTLMEVVKRTSPRTLSQEFDQAISNPVNCKSQAIFALLEKSTSSVDHSKSVRQEEDMEVDSEQASDLNQSLNQENDGLANLEEDGTVRQEAEQAMTAVLCTFTTEEFLSMINGLVHKVIKNEEDSYGKVVILDIWQKLLYADLDDDKYTAVQYATQDLLLGLQQIMKSLGSKPASDVNTEVACALLQMETAALAAGQSFLSQQAIPLCLQSCIYLPLEDASVATFVRLYTASYDVVNAAFIHHPHSIVKMVPVCTALMCHLLVHIIRAGDQDVPHSKDEIKQLVKAGHLIDRLCGLVETYKVDFNKVALYLVAEFVQELQKLTLLPSIKNAVLPGIYKLLDLCDQHSVALLFTVLPSGVKEIFRLLYADYKKYHKYTGKV